MRTTALWAAARAAAAREGATSRVITAFSATRRGEGAPRACSHACVHLRVRAARVAGAALTLSNVAQGLAGALCAGHACAARGRRERAGPGGTQPGYGGAEPQVRARGSAPRGHVLFPLHPRVPQPRGGESAAAARCASRATLDERFRVSQFAFAPSRGPGPRVAPAARRARQARLVRAPHEHKWARRGACDLRLSTQQGHLLRAVQARLCGRRGLRWRCTGARCAQSAWRQVADSL
jgi:hypothetical protein